MKLPRHGRTRSFDKLRSRRREEADAARVAGGPPPHVGGYRPPAFLRLGVRSGFSLVETMVAIGVGMLVMGGAASFLYFASVSFSGITSQNLLNGQAGNAVEWIQSRARLATYITNDTAGNILTLGFDDNPTVDSDGDDMPYDDKNHFEQFKFIGFNSTNSAACSSNRLVYIPNTNSAANQVLIKTGVRNLPGYKIFTVTNGATAVIRFGIVDSFVRDYYQAIDMQATALPLNRPSTTNIIGIIP